MSDVVMDDTGTAPAILTVVFKDRTVKSEPDPKDALDSYKEYLDAHRPEGYVSSSVELVEPEEEPK